MSHRGDDGEKNLGMTQSRVIMKIHGGALVDKPGGTRRAIEAESKSQRLKPTPLYWRGEAEPQACVTEVEMGTRQTEAEPKG